MRVFINIKPTKHNKKVLKKRGLFSDDSRQFFNMYELIMNNTEFVYEVGTDAKLSEEFSRAGLKF